MHRQIVKMEYESIKIKENINRHWIDGDNIASPSPSNGLKSKKKRKKAIQNGYREVKQKFVVSMQNGKSQRHQHRMCRKPILSA
jgi:hypothetical protein